VGARNKRTVEVLVRLTTFWPRSLSRSRATGWPYCNWLQRSSTASEYPHERGGLAAKYERPTAVIMKEVPRDMAPEAVDARIRELMKRVLPERTIEATFDKQD
jgi:hypothetical protein